MSRTATVSTRACWTASTHRERRIRRGVLRTDGLKPRCLQNRADSFLRLNARTQRAGRSVKVSFLPSARELPQTLPNGAVDNRLLNDRGPLLPEPTTVFTQLQQRREHAVRHIPSCHDLLWLAPSTTT